MCIRDSDETLEHVRVTVEFEERVAVFLFGGYGFIPAVLVEFGDCLDVYKRQGQYDCFTSFPEFEGPIETVYCHCHNLCCLMLVMGCLNHVCREVQRCV